MGEETTPIAPVARHSISSPPPPARYHKAMIALHQFTLEKHKKPELDFLSFWFAESRNQVYSISEPEDHISEILSGLETFRDNVVEQSRGRSVSLLAVRGVVFDLERSASFTETREYWQSVLESLQNQPSSLVTLSDLSEAVVSFLKSVESGDTSSSSAQSLELDALRTYINQSLTELRTEIKRESLKMKAEIKSVTSGITTAVGSVKSSPTPLPALPIESRRTQEEISGSRGSRREWCGSCAEDPCVMQ